MKSVQLNKYEIEVLVSWHREQKWECAQKENYLEADEHKKRDDELSKIAEDA